MRKTKVLLIILAVLVAAAALALLINNAIERQGAVASMTWSRYNCKVVALDDKLLIFGGMSNVRNRAVQIEEYDVPTGRLTTRKAGMKTLQHCFAAAAAKGKVYLVGSDEKGSIEEYDPFQDVTTLRPPSKVWRSDVGAIGLNGKVYVVGGIQGGKACGITEEYDPDSDSWTRRANMPTPRGGLCLVALKGKIYAVGGSNEEGGSAAVEEYEPATDQWQKKANMRYTRTFFGAAATDHTILAFGGQKSSQEITFLNSVEEFRPAENAWTERNELPYKLGCMDAGIVRGKAYLCGGLTMARAIKAVIWPGDIGARQIMEYPIE